MTYRFAIKSHGLYTPSFTLSKRSSGVFLTLRDPFLQEKRSIHFENDIKHDKRHLYRGYYGERPKKRRYKVVGDEKGRQLAPECSYLLGSFALCATEEEFRKRKKSHLVEVFRRDIGKNDIVTIHLVSSPREFKVDCPPSFEIIKEVTDGPVKWMAILEDKAVHSAYDMVTRSVLSSNCRAVAHGPESKGKHKHMILISDLHEDYRPQKHAQMSVVVANKDLKLLLSLAN